MKYLDLFAGIGGFTLGIEQAYEIFKTKKERVGKKNENKIRGGGDKVDDERNQGLGDSRAGTQQHIVGGADRQPACVGYSEIDKYAIQIYEKHYPSHKNYGDITKIDEQRLPDFDLLCGGFPCQSFSIAGKRGGFEDTRGTLFFDIARIIKHKRPRLLLLENVRGLLSHDEGRTFNTIILTLEELGYDLQWQVLNSKNFGVPQNRERVFIIGHLRGTSRPKVFPFRSHDETSIHSQGRAEPKTKPASAITTREGGRKENNFVVTFPVNTHKGYAEAREGDGINLSFPKSKTRRGRVIKKFSPTLQTNESVGTIDGSQIRRLTPTECERLQGFPDGWTEGVSDTQRYKTLGNAVTVNVIKAIVEKLI